MKPKSRKQRQSAKIGDVIEIEVPAGLAYAQYSHYLRGWGELIRVMPGIFQSRPDSFAELVNQEEQFFVFYPIAVTVRSKLVTVVANEEVPARVRDFPLMRWPGLPDIQGRFSDWWLFDGTKETPVKALTPEMERLSVAESWGHPVLVERISQGWTPEQFWKTIPGGVADDQDVESRRRRVSFYLYFPKREDATIIGDFLKADGLDVEISKSATGKDWLVLVSISLDPATEIQNMREYLDRKHGWLLQKYWSRSSGAELEFSGRNATGGEILRVTGLLLLVPESLGIRRVASRFFVNAPSKTVFMTSFHREQLKSQFGNRIEGVEMTLERARQESHWIRDRISEPNK